MQQKLADESYSPAHVYRLLFLIQANCCLAAKVVLVPEVARCA